MIKSCICLHYWVKLCVLKLCQDDIVLIYRLTVTYAVQTTYTYCLISHVKIKIIYLKALFNTVLKFRKTIFYVETLFELTSCPLVAPCQLAAALVHQMLDGYLNCLGSWRMHYSS